MQYDVTHLNLEEINILMAGLGNYQIKRKGDKIFAIITEMNVVEEEPSTIVEERPRRSSSR